VTRGDLLKAPKVAKTPHRSLHFLLVFYTAVVALGAGAAVLRADDAKLKLILEAVSAKASPGLAAVVSVTLVNESSDVFDAPDLWSDPFWSSAWRWTWKSGDISYRISERDVSYGSIPETLAVPPIRIRPGGKHQWVAVIPTPDVLGGLSKATLTCDCEVLPHPKLASSAEFLLGDPVAPANVPGVDARFVRSAISTGMEAMSWDGCPTPEAKAALRRQAFVGDDTLLLAWFCASLADKGRFDEEAWTRLNHASGDKRTIRDANLFRVLASGRVRLTKAQADRVVKHIDASYPFSDSLAAAALAAVKK
jgi:hypothetical protein